MLAAPCFYKRLIACEYARIDRSDFCKKTKTLSGGPGGHTGVIIGVVIVVLVAVGAVVAVLITCV